METKRRLAIVLAAAAALGVGTLTQHVRAQEKETKNVELRVYAQDAKGKYLGGSDASVLVYLQPPAGEQQMIRTTPVQPRAAAGHDHEEKPAAKTKGKAQSKPEAKHGHDEKGDHGHAAPHGGQVVKTDDMTVEFVAIAPHGHGDGHEAEHKHADKKGGHDDAKKADDHHADNAPYFNGQFDPAKLPKFEAVVVVRQGQQNRNFKGFKYPAFVMPEKFADAAKALDQLSEDIEHLIERKKLGEIHAVAEKVTAIGKVLPQLPGAPAAQRQKVSALAQKLVAFFPEIDEPADAGNQAATEAVFRKFQSVLTELKSVK